MRLRSALIDVSRLMAGLLVLAAIVRINSSSTAQAVMQQDDNPVTLRSDTRVVQIDVTVQDSQGRAVEDLKASDFAVTDNGRSRSFTIFSTNFDKHVGSPSETPKGLPQHPALPPNVFTNTGAAAIPPDGHSTVILLDAENGWADNFTHGRQGVIGLLTKLPADEKIAVYVISKGAGMSLLQDYTLDRSKVEAAVTKFVPRGMIPAPATMQHWAGEPLDVNAHLESLYGAKSAVPGSSDKLSTPPPRISQYEDIRRREGSDDVRRSFDALAQQLRNVPGRKSVFWITQGFPPTEIKDGRGGWDKTVAALNDANIAVNTVDSNGTGGAERFQGANAILALREIANVTGGQAYIDGNDLGAAMASGVAASRSSYTLGFYLTEMDGKFHELKVNVNRPNLQLNYRQGYYAQAEVIKQASGKKSSLEEALLNPSASTEVRIIARLDIAPGKPRATLKTRLILDAEPLSLKQAGSGYTGKVEELFLELDAAGREVGRYKDFKEFTVTAANKPKFDAQGAILSQAIPLEANAVSVSVVVRDTASGRTGSIVIPLDKVTPQKPAN